VKINMTLTENGQPNDATSSGSGRLQPQSTTTDPFKRMQLAGGMRLSTWRKAIGISKMTAYRWRKKNKINIIWRYGQPWVTAETIRNFFTDDGTKPRTIPASGSR
jgi:hypothetical protein